MTTYNDRLSLVAFLASCSRTSLEDFLLAKQNRISNLEKDVRDLIERLAENIAFVELANILREYERSDQGRGVDESMSWKASGAAKQIKQGVDGQRIGMGDKLVLMMLADYCDPETGFAWPSQKLLAQECICSERGLRKILEKLEDVGLIQIDHRGDKGNRYRLLFNPKERGDMRNVVPHQVKLYEEPGFLIMRNPGSSKPSMNHQSGEVPVSRRPPVVPVPAPIDDDQLQKLLLEKFKTDPRFYALDQSHIAVAIQKIRERAATPPMSLKYWFVSVERFLVDYAGEVAARASQTAIDVEGIRPGPVTRGPVRPEVLARHRERK